MVRRESRPVGKYAYSLDSIVFVLYFHVLMLMYHLTVIKFLLPACLLLSMKMIKNYIEIFLLPQRFLACVACIIDTMHLLGITFSIS